MSNRGYSPDCHVDPKAAFSPPECRWLFALEEAYKGEVRHGNSRTPPTYALSAVIDQLLKHADKIGLVSEDIYERANLIGVENFLTQSS